MGLHLTSGPNLEAGLEVGRQQFLSSEAEHALQLRGSLRW